MFREIKSRADRYFFAPPQPSELEELAQIAAAPLADLALPSWELDLIRYVT
jgi:hypothetical protein